MKGIILALMAILGFAGATAAQPSMEELVKKWDERRAGIKCVKYELEETTTYYQPEQPRDPRLPAGAALRYPPVMYQLQMRRTFVFDLATGRYRRETGGDTWNIKEHKIAKHRGATIFANGVLKSVKWPEVGETNVGKDTARRSDFVEITGDLRSQEFPLEHRPLLYDMGIVPLVAGKNLGPKDFCHYKPSEYADAATPDRSAPLAQGVARYKLAPSGSAGGYTGACEVVLTRDSLVGNYTVERPLTKMTFRTTAEHRLLSPGRWTTSRWTALVVSDSAAVSKSELRVVSVNYNHTPTEAEFELTPEPGMVLNKLEIPDTGATRVAAPENHLFKVGTSGTLIPLDNSASLRQWWLYTLGLLALCLVASTVWLKLRVRRSRHPLPPRQTT